MYILDLYGSSTNSSFVWDVRAKKTSHNYIVLWNSSADNLVLSRMIENDREQQSVFKLSSWVPGPLTTYRIRSRRHVAEETRTYTSASGSHLSHMPSARSRRAVEDSCLASRGVTVLPGARIWLHLGFHSRLSTLERQCDWQWELMFRC